MNAALEPTTHGGILDQGVALAPLNFLSVSRATIVHPIS
jgi:hypothetical protein